MNLLQNRTMHPPLREEEALVIENAIRLAIDSIINVLYSVNGARTREYERMLGVRDKEIRRLSGREKDFERELQLLRRQGCSCGLYDAAAAAADDHCGSSGFPDPLLQNPDCGDPGGDPGPGCGDPRPRFDDPRPGCEDAADEMAAAHGQCELSFSLGLFDASPSQVSAQSQDLAAPPPPPAVRSSFQQPPVHPAPQALAPLEERPAPPNGPVIKEEPSDMDAICESGDLHGMLGHGELGGPFRGGLYPSPEPLGLGGSEQHMMSRPRLEPDEAQRLKREAWRAASRRYYARKMARLRAHRPPQGQLHPLGASASACYMPASMTAAAAANNNNNNSNSSSSGSIHHHINSINSSRRRRKLTLDLPEETQSAQREAWRAASKRYHARRATGHHPPDHLDLAHFLQDTQPSGMGGPQS